MLDAYQIVPIGHIYMDNRRSFDIVGSLRTDFNISNATIGSRSRFAETILSVTDIATTVNEQERLAEARV